MLNSLIRGGQVAAHAFRMFKQNFIVTVKISLIGSCICFLVLMSIDKSIDYLSLLSLQQARCMNFIDNIMPGKDDRPKQMLFKSSRKGNKMTYVGSVLASKYLHNQELHFVQKLKKKLLESTGIFGAIFCIFFLFWLWVGNRSKEKRLEKGSHILSARNVREYLKKKEMIGNIWIDDLPLMKDIETQHILITGGTGSGKTNCFHTILPQIRKRADKAIIVDTNAELLGHYYDASRGDIILNPFDVRGMNWDFWSDVTPSNGDYDFNSNLENVARVLFTPKDRVVDSFWYDAGRLVFLDVVTEMLKEGDYKIENLLAKMLTIKIDKLRAYIQSAEGDSARFLEPGNDRLLGSVLSTIVGQVRPLKLLCKQKPALSLKEWVRDSKSKGWLFLLSTTEQRELMRPLMACSIDLLTRELMSLNPDPERRLWFVQDELPALGRLPVLKSLMSETRKYGGCVIAGIQSINQLYDLYGAAEGSTILSQFNTRIMFRNLDFRLAKQFSETFGTAEYSEAMESFSYGSHEMRDGVSVSRRKIEKPLLAVDEIMNLENLECFVSQPDPEIRLTKLKMSLKKMPLLCENIILDSVTLVGDEDLQVASASNRDKNALSIESKDSAESKSKKIDIFDDKGTSNCHDKDQNEILLEKEVSVVQSKEEQDTQ